MAARKPATRTRQAEQKSSLAVVIVGLSLVLACGAAYLMVPASPVIWLGLVVAAFMEPATVLTGKEKSGNPTPAGQVEENQYRAYRFHRRMRLSLTAPSPAWLPGWPVQATFLMALGIAAVAWSQPLADWLPWWARAVNAAAAYVTVAAIGHTRRTVTREHNCPGTHTGALPDCVRLGPSWWACVAAGVITAGAGVWLVLDRAIAFVPDDTPLWVGCIGLAVATLTLAVLPLWRRESLRQWRIDCAARDEWEPRWQGLKHDPAPYLTRREQVGSATLDTFTAPAHLGAATFTPMLGKLSPSLGTGRHTAILETPDVGSDATPIAGSVHPLRFQVATWAVEETPDVSAPATSQDEVRLWAQAAMNQISDTGYSERMILTDLEPITTPDSAKVAWTSKWVSPGAGLSVGTLRTREETGPLNGAFGADVLIDHRADCLYFGALGDEDSDFTDGEDTSAALERLATEDYWNRVWSTSSKQTTNQPTIQHATYASGHLAAGQKVQRQVFVTRIGVDPAEYRGTEPRLSASMAAAPFVAVTGWPAPDQRPGERHPQAVCVYWSAEPVPDSPQKLAPSPGRTTPAADPAVWVLAGVTNKAFDAAKLARPEVVTARCLTTPDAPGHLWRIRLRLHGGVVAEDVRAKQAKLRSALGVEWLRIADVDDAIELYAGARREHVELARPDQDRDALVALDWGQAFLDAKLTGAGGDLPTLARASVLEHNAAVQDLTFELPSGLDIHRVRGALDKLKTTTGNYFIEARTAPEGPTFVRLLVCRTNPLPDMCRTDIDAIDTSIAARQGVPFATGVEGEPVRFDPAEDPHALLAGLTGSGKSSQAQVLLYGALVAGHKIVVIDPMKGGADFKFLEPYWWGFADDQLPAAALMKAIYDEVDRRKNLNAKHGVGSYRDLPEDVRPEHITVFIDEFTSLIGADKLPPQADDPEAQRAREAAETVNAAKAITGTFAGKLAREARSAGITLLLGTQKLNAKMLDSVPSGGDLKTNLARGLLGNTTLGDRQSALRDWQSAPKIDAPAIGRGYWESNAAHPVQVQTWYATQDEYAQALAGRVEPISDDERLDYSAYLPTEDEEADQFGPPPGMVFGSQEEAQAAEPEVVELDELTLDLGDLEEDSEEAGGEEDEEARGTEPVGDRPNIEALFETFPELEDVPASNPGDVVGWGDDLDWEGAGETVAGREAEDVNQSAPDGEDSEDDREDEVFPTPERTPRSLVLTDTDPFA